MGRHGAEGKRKDSSSRQKSPTKRQKSVPEGVDDVDGLSPGFGFTPSTARARLRRLRESRQMDTSDGSSNTNNAASNAASGSCRVACCPRTPICRRRESRQMDTSDGSSTTNNAATNAASGSSSAACWPWTPHITRKLSCIPTLSCDSCLEEDGIYTTRTTTKALDASALDVPDSFASANPNDSPAVIRSLFGKSPKPDIQTNILIPHPEQTDTPIGDYFGADLATFHDLKRNYFQHLLRNITKNGVADDMRFKNDDELVLLNDHFVPSMTNCDVINLFHKVPVDGHTRLSFVFRRVVRKNGKKWQWYMTSSILCPIGRGQTPPTKEDKFETLPGNEYTNQQQVKLRCLVGNQYLDIKDSAITAGPLYDDHMKDCSKIIQQTTRFFEGADTIPTWRSTLRGTVGACPYVGVSMINQTEPTTDQMWYNIKYSGASVSFKYKDVYLAVERDRVVTRKEEHFFVMFAGKQEDGYDEMDGSPSSQPESLESLSQSSNSSSLKSEGSSGYGSQMDTVVKVTPVTTRSQLKRTSSANTPKTPTTPFEGLSFLDK